MQVVTHHVFERALSRCHKVLVLSPDGAEKEGLLARGFSKSGLPVAQALKDRAVSLLVCGGAPPLREQEQGNSALARTLREHGARSLRDSSENVDELHTAGVEVDESTLAQLKQRRTLLLQSSDTLSVCDALDKAEMAAGSMSYAVTGTTQVPSPAGAVFSAGQILTLSLFGPAAHKAQGKLCVEDAPRGPVPGSPTHRRDSSNYAYMFDHIDTGDDGQVIVQLPPQTFFVPWKASAVLVTWDGFSSPFIVDQSGLQYVVTRRSALPMWGTYQVTSTPSGLNSRPPANPIWKRGDTVTFSDQATPEMQVVGTSMWTCTVKDRSVVLVAREGLFVLAIDSDTVAYVLERT